MPSNAHYHLVRLWFLANLMVSLYPPFYWSAGKSRAFILGLPVSLLYFLAISLSITLSILYAYWQEPADEDLY